MHSRLVYLTLLACAKSYVFADLRSGLTGKGFPISFPGDSSYSSVSQAYNLRFDFQPAVVAFPNTPQDISEIVTVGVQNKLQIVARSGGHSYIANGLGGKNGVLVVDMRNFTNISVDSSSGNAVIGTGNRLGDIALALNNNGRALPHGTCPYVGIGGHSGYGGFGFTSREWGLTLDTILSLDIVLANGTITTASANQNMDLYWALRGASGSYGIVTSITVKTFPAPPSATVFEYNWNLNAADAASFIGSFQTYVQSNIPPQFGAEIVLGKGSAKGKVSVGLTGGYYGPSNQVNSTLAPFLNTIPKPSSTKFTIGSYINSVTYLGGLNTLNTNSAPDHTDTFYAKSLMTPEASPMSTAALNAFTNYLANQGFTSDTNWFVEVELYGGSNSAINAVPQNGTAFSHRSSMFTIQFYASSSNSLPPYPSDGFAFLDNMVNAIINNSPSNWDYGAYINYIDDQLQNGSNLYYGSSYPGLQSLKQTYDPNSVFSFPQGIQI